MKVGRVGASHYCSMHSSVIAIIGDNNNINNNIVCLDEELLRKQQAQEEMDDLAEQEQLSELHAKQLMEKLRVIEEDDEFDLAFRAVLQDSVSSVTAASKNNLDKMVIPAILPKPKNTFRLQNDDDDRMMERQQGKGI